MAHCQRAVDAMDRATTPVRTLAAVRQCVAELEVRMGDLDRAEAIYLDLAEEIERRDGLTHPSRASVFSGLGAIYLERGWLEQADAALPDDEAY